MDATLPDAQSEARAILLGSAPVVPRRALELEALLRAQRQFGLARRLLARAAADPGLLADAALARQIAQKRCLNTYKDPDLQADWALDEAMRLLQAADDLQTTTDPESLGLAGSIHKARWELSSQERQLSIALSYYYRGSRQGVAADLGYNAINAAFVLDSLAALETVPGQPDELGAAARQQQALAQRLRREIVDTLPALAAQPGRDALNREWWFLATLGEAFFGLAQFDDARAWLMRAAALPEVASWQQESTARQLAGLLRLMQRQGTLADQASLARARAVLHEFLGRNAAAVDSVVRGKVGLGLSGGGFRASFYHLGVLAKLAELDLLRHVEYLSCVSGGSIVGAHLYLELRKLLGEKSDEQITRQDYVDVVARIERDFFDGVTSNIRTRIGAEWITNLKMIFLPGFSRTQRAGDLYERCIYSRVQDDDGRAGKPRWLDELKVQPRGEAPGFAPKNDNWRRAAKVPVLVLNATTLNSGHNWQFTASWMGEPPAGIHAEVDANFRLRRMYYGEAPEGHRKVRLGHAVAASACVPGIFEPLALSGLYERKPPDRDKPVQPVVRLVDGGVHDNQGIGSLLEQGCRVMMVSDASGQMGDLDFPSNGLIGVPLRTTSILQSRVRVSQFEDLASRRKGGLLNGFMFVHMKKGLETPPVDWPGCSDPSPPPSAEALLPYGIQRHVQRALAAIRTDLDSFSETEANALMCSGYLTTEQALAEPVLGFAPPPQPRAPWRFLALEPLLKDPDPGSRLMRQLAAASQTFFKVWLLTRQLQIVAGVLAALLLGMLAWLAIGHWSAPLATISVSEVVLAALAAVLSLLGLGVLARLVDYRKTASDVLIGLGMATLGFLLARLHLHVFDKMFLRQGRLDRLLSRPPRSGP